MRATVAVSFSAAKRLRDYAGKCAQLHGYQHRIEATFENADANAAMVVDFYQAKAALQQWVDAHWDHTVILPEADRALGDAIAAYTGQVIFYLPADPTAENLAAHVMHHVCPKILPQVRCVSLRLYDTADAWVEI